MMGLGQGLDQLSSDWWLDFGDLCVFSDYQNYFKWVTYVGHLGIGMIDMTKDWNDFQVING